MKNKVVLYIISICILVVALTTIITVQINISELEEQKERLEAQKELLVDENERLEHDIAQDVTDEYIIRIMRKLGYYFPGEKVGIANSPENDE